MTKKVNIDTLLSQSELVLTLGDKEYVVHDIPMEVFMSAMDVDPEKDRDILHGQLAKMLGVDKKVLKDVGLRAAGMALNEIRRWVTGAEENEAIRKSTKGNP